MRRSHGGRSAAWVSVSLLLGTTVALLTAGCGTSSVHVANNASARVSTVATHQGQVFRVPSGSMEPTLPIGMKVVVKKRSPTVGALVVVHPPEGALQLECGPKPHVLRPGGAACDTPVPRESETIELIERIVARPGDEIYVRAGHVYRKAKGSGTFVRESDSYIRACGASPGCNFPVPIKISAGHWFLMGDNRGASGDSRSWGPLPMAWIVGVATDSIPRSRSTAIKLPSKHASFRSRAVAKVAACLHRAGVTIPRVDSALLSSTGGIRTRSPRVKAIIGKCRNKL
jgi:signal peptidase I